MPLAIRPGSSCSTPAAESPPRRGTYVGIRYWGGLLWLLNAAVVGWLIGRRRVRAVLAVEIAANLIHIALDLAFVLGLGWGVAGVAAATLLSEAGKLARRDGDRRPRAAGAGALGRGRRGARPGPRRARRACCGSTATSSSAPCCSPARSCC